MSCHRWATISPSLSSNRAIARTSEAGVTLPWRENLSSHSTETGPARCRREEALQGAGIQKEEEEGGL